MASVERPPPSVLCMLPSGGQVKILHQIYLVMFLCGYVRILLPVAICTVIFVTGFPQPCVVVESQHLSVTLLVAFEQQGPGALLKCKERNLLGRKFSSVCQQDSDPKHRATVSHKHLPGRKASVLQWQVKSQPSSQSQRCETVAPVESMAVQKSQPTHQPPRKQSSQK